MRARGKAAQRGCRIHVELWNEKGSNPRHVVVVVVVVVGGGGHNSNSSGQGQDCSCGHSDNDSGGGGRAAAAGGRKISFLLSGVFFHHLCSLALRMAAFGCFSPV